MRSDGGISLGDDDLLLRMTMRWWVNERRVAGKMPYSSSIILPVVVSNLQKIRINAARGVFVLSGHAKPCYVRGVLQSGVVGLQSGSVDLRVCSGRGIGYRSREDDLRRG